MANIPDRVFKMLGSLTLVSACFGFGLTVTWTVNGAIIISHSKVIHTNIRISRVETGSDFLLCAGDGEGEEGRRRMRNIMPGQAARV